MDKYKPGAKVLEIGCGSGYLCAAFYELVKEEEVLNEKPKTLVVGIEVHPDLHDLTWTNLTRLYGHELESE